MFPLFSLSPLIAIAAIVGFLILNGKVNRLQSEIEMLKKGVAPKPLPSNMPREAAEAEAPGFSPERLIPVQVPVSTQKINEETSGQWLGKIGVLAILFGVSFFLKYAFDNDLIGETGRVMLGVLGGIAFIGFGQYLSKKYFTYAQFFQGGGVGIFYLTIFAAFAYYHMIDQTPAFLLMALVTAFSVILSIFSGTIHLAVLGIIGGFLTPVLISTGHNNLVGLFSYILLLDVGILFVAYFRKWMKLNYLGFFGTVILFTGWFGQYYNSEELGQTMFFLSLFFLVYLFVSVLHHLVRKEDSTNADVLLVTLNAGLYFFASYIILDTEYHALMGFFAAFVALIYFFLGFISKASAPQNKLLNLYLPGIAVVFLSIAIPLQISGYWITIAWMAEACVLFLVSGYANMSSVRTFGVVVYAVSLFRYFVIDFSYSNYYSSTVVFNHRFLTLLLGVAVAYSIASFYNKLSQVEIGKSVEYKKVCGFFVVLATLLTIFLGSWEINFYYNQQIALVQKDASVQMESLRQYSGQDYYSSPSYQKISTDLRETIDSLKNEENTAISIFWALYAILMIGIGLYASLRVLRRIGVVFFFITALKIFIDVWNLGPLYRIISSIAFGVIALAASFLFVKYKDKI